jgi:hypothetical protein
LKYIVKKLTYREYQEIADSFLKSVGIGKNSRFPFEIDLLADKAGYNIIPISNMKRDFGVKGVVIRRKAGGFDIGIDERHYMNDDMYFPFTIAEELGHILAHPSIYQDIHSVEDSIRVLCDADEEDYRRLEQQARNVGSNILLPSFLFDNFILDYCRKNETEIKLSARAESRFRLLCFLTVWMP